MSDDEWNDFESSCQLTISMDNRSKITEGHAQKSNDATFEFLKEIIFDIFQPDPNLNSEETFNVFEFNEIPAKFLTPSPVSVKSNSYEESETFRIIDVLTKSNDINCDDMCAKCQRSFLRTVPSESERLNDNIQSNKPENHCESQFNEKNTKCDPNFSLNLNNPPLEYFNIKNIEICTIFK